MVSVFEVHVKYSRPFGNLEARATVYTGFATCRVRWVQARYMFARHRPSSLATLANEFGSAVD